MSESDPLDRPATPEEIEMVRLLEEARAAKGKRPRQSHIFDRDDDDFYVEPAWCSARLFAVETFTGPIWDPAAGLGTIPRAARAAGLSNLASDIADEPRFGHRRSRLWGVSGFFDGTGADDRRFQHRDQSTVCARGRIRRTRADGWRREGRGDLSDRAVECCEMASGAAAGTDLVAHATAINAARQHDPSR